MLDPMSVLLFCLIALSWYFWCIIITEESGWINLFSNTIFLDFPIPWRATVSVLSTFLICYFVFFPASLLLFLPWRNRFKNLRSQPLLLISLIFIAVTLVFYSISSTKLPGYVARAFPFMAALLGWRVKELTKIRGYYPFCLLIGFVLLAIPFVVFFTGDLQRDIL